MIAIHSEKVAVVGPLSASECSIAALSWQSVRGANIAGLRPAVAQAYPDSLSAGVLKQADEQSVLALHALHLARCEIGLTLADTEHWGLIATARMPGRKRIADSLIKFRDQGAWGTSPHLIPYCTLHSMAGLLSQALRLHGPNYGTGGLKNSEAESIWAGLTLLHGEQLPGVWIVLSGWDRETLTIDDAVCQAAVIGLRHPAARGEPRLRFALKPTRSAPETLTLESLGAAIQKRSAAHWNIGGATLRNLVRRKLPGGRSVMNTPAIVITGVGAGTPLGWDFAAVAKNLLEGRSAIRKVDSFDITQHPSQIAALLDPIPCPAGFDEEVFGQRHRLAQLSLWCCTQALRDAGLWDQREQKRIGLVIGTATEWGWYWEDDLWSRQRQAICDPQYDPPALIATIQQELGLNGPAITMSAACASGNFAFAQARRWLQMGWVDVCVAGGCDTAVTPMTLASFGNLRALSRQNDRPAAASRPFDRDRDGFVLGEGGAVFVLENESTARKRGVHIYGELAGCGLSSDAYHPVIPAPEPTQSIQAIRNALHDARVDPSEINYVNAHGTSTPVGDVAESKSLREVFGEQIKNIPVSSTKSMTGHLLTAAAAIEALACLATFEYGAIPPTINLDNPDPECDLRHVPHHAIEAPVHLAISNSFGFGGSNSCVVFRAA